MWPFGPVATVYDVLDTYDVADPQAEGLPENIATFFAVGDVSAARMDNFERLLVPKRIYVEWLDHGDASAGRIQQEGDDGRTERNVSYTIKINKNHTPPIQFTTLAHELAHLFLGHIGSNQELEIPHRRRLSFAEREVEAECTAYLVCVRNGLTDGQGRLHVATASRPEDSC